MTGRQDQDSLMARNMVREPAVAGSFYPASPSSIALETSRLLGGGGAPVGSESPDGAGSAAAAARSAIAVVSPHAGWRYAGALAGQLFASVVVPARVVVMAPNHTGRGARASVWPDGSWRLPGLDVPIDGGFARRLLANAAAAGVPLEADCEAHLEEHAIEVLLPLLAARQPTLHLVPVVLGGLSFRECEALAAALAHAVRETDGSSPAERSGASGAGAPASTLIVASSDMSHYLPDADTRAIDRLALAPLTSLNARGLWEAVRENGITMCGYIPTTVALLAAQALGGRHAQLVGYATSADAGGDRDRVVGYAAVAVF